MKRPITNLVLGWLAFMFISFQINAQTTFAVDPQNVTGNPGDQITVDITVSEFTNVLNFQYSMTWDPTIIEWVSPVGVPGNLNGLSATSSFGTNNAGTGVLTVSWLDPDVSGVTLPNGTIIYSLTFNVLSSSGTNIEFGSTPTSIEVVDGNGNAVNFVGEDGMVNGGGSGGGGGNGNPGDLIITMGNVTAAAGSNICVDFEVENFDNILNFQYSMHFDPAVLSFTGVDGLNVPGLASSSFGTNNASNGDLTVSWLDPDVSGVTIPNGTVIYQLCFDVIGSSGQSSNITIDGSPTAIEVIDGSSNAVNLSVNSGSVTVDGGSPPPPPPVSGFAIIASDQEVENGNNFCMQFSTQDFTNILSMQYTMEYDASQLSFTGVQGLNLDGLTSALFNAGTPGVITMSWLDPNVSGITLADGTVIYELCFDAIGPNNCNNSTQLTFTGSQTPIEVLDGDENEVDFGSVPGVTTICDDPNGGGPTTPTNLTFTASSESGLPGETLCVDISVDLFDCVVSAQFTMHFDPNVLEYTGVDNLNLPGLAGSQFGAAGAATGSVTWSWLDPDVAGVSVPDGTIIYSVCFDVVGDLGDTSPFTFDGTPTIVEVTDCNPSNPTPDFVAGTQTIENSCPGPVSITASQVTDIACFGANSGTVDISVSGGDGTYEFTWTNSGGTVIGTNEDIAGVGPGTISVLVESCNGNETATASYTITQPASGMTISGTATPVACFGETTGSVNISVAGGSVNGCNLTYAWSNGASTEDLSNIGAGTYVVTVTDCNNCQATSTFNVVGPPSELTMIATPTPTRCNADCNGELVIAPNGGIAPYQYMLNSGPWNNIANYNDLCAGSYLVKVRDAFGCIISSNQVISAPSAIGLSAAATNSINGNDGSVDLTPTGGTPGYAYNWSGPNNFSAITQDIDNLAPGDYCVTVSDNNDCTETLCEEVQAPLSLDAMTETPSCFGQCTGELEVVFTGGTAPFQYLWSNSQTTNPAVGLCPGLYIVTVTSSDGQSATLMGTVDGASTPVTINDTDLTLISTPTATDGSISLDVSGGFGNYTYNWSNGQTGQTATGLAAGAYSVTVTDQFGCTTSGGPYTVFFSTSQLGLGFAGSAVCIDDVADGGTLTLNIAGGLAPYDIQFSGPDVIDPFTNYSENQLDISGLSPGTYFVTVTDAAPGTFNQEIDLQTEVRLIDIEIDPVIVTPVTNGLNGAIDITVSGGDPIYTFQWNAGPMPSSQDQTGLLPGSYDVFIEDNNGCVEEFTGILVEPMLANESIVQPDCPNDTNGSISLSPSGSGNTPYTYSWSNAAGNVSMINGLGLGIYTVTITDAIGASIVESYTISAISNLNADWEQDGDILCFGDATGGATVTPFDGMPPYNYSWSNGTTGESLMGVMAGDFTVTITDDVGCEISEMVTITGEPALVVTVDANSNGGDCTEGNGTAMATVVGGMLPYSYQWNDALNQTSKTAILLSPGGYTVTVTDGNGCTESTDAFIDQVDPLTVEGISIPDSGGPDGQAIAVVTSGTYPYSYEWRDYVNTDSILAELLPGDYWVKVTDDAGCEELVKIVVEDLTICLEASAIITPDGDGFNEEFKIGCLSRYTDNKLELFNRWGQLVFLANDYNNGNLWRGTNRSGNEVPDGVYYYVFEYVDPVSGSSQTLKGAVTVLRK